MSLIRGNAAERQASRYLQKKGFKILETNKRYKFGEIDIIAEHEDQRVFVEVKFRKDSSFGRASDFVNAAKQRRLTLAAQCWIKENDPCMHFNYRFDVIAIEGENKNNQELNWITNAFEADFL